MRNKIAIEVLNEEIEILGLPKISSLEYLNNEEPVIYLCGKSSTGKTTFLNALFNFKKDELYTSTDISTKTEFRFKYGLEKKITTKENKEIILPSNYIDRKDLFESLNREGEKYTINLDSKAIRGRTIVDIPGVFDFKRNDVFSNQMLNEADIVYFFTPCTSKINSNEYELLRNISNTGIPIVVLFTMGDLIDADEGITRKTMPNLVESRLITCFEEINISHHQIISSNDFYKGKEHHGIDKLQIHITSNDQDYKRIAEDKRLKKTVKYYINLIHQRIINLESESKTFISLVYRENELWQKAEKIKIDDEKHITINTLESELNWFYKNCEDIIYGKSYSKIFRKATSSLEEQKEKFETTWNDFWQQINEGFDISIPKLPDFNKGLFEQVTIDLDKINSIISGESSATESKDSSKNYESNEEKKTTTVNDKSNEKNEVTPKAVKSNKPSLADFIVLIAELGVNLRNAKIIYQKWSFLEEVKEIIENVKIKFNKRLDIEFKKKINDLEIEMKQRIDSSLLDNKAKKIIDSYEKVLIKFKSIINDF